MKKLIFCAAILATILACNQPKTETASDATGAKALYEKNLASLQSGISAFEKEDINGWAATVADSAKWSSPMYGAPEGKKEDWKNALSSYMADWDGLKLENANFLPGIDSTTHEPDGSVRYYGVWTGVHKSGVKTSLKFYGTYDFNKDGKIVFGDEYFDLGGVMNAVKPK